MATLSTTSPTLADLAARMTADGSIDQNIIEILAQTNEILDDAAWIEANGFTEHKTTVRSGMPSGTWRKLNYGVQPSKSTTVTVKDSMGMLEDYAKIDKSLADLNGNSAAWRMSEEKGFIAGLSKTLAQTIFYGDSSLNPERFMGLAPRFSSLAAENGENILDAGGTGSDNTSVWIIVWDQNAAHMIYPKGSAVGLQTRDLGEATLVDAAGGEYQGYRTHYKWDAGMTVRDWTKVVRIANIDVSDLTKNAASGADLIDLLVRGLEQLNTDGTGRVAIYCNRTVRSFLRRQIGNKANVNLSMAEVGGKRVVSFDEVPVRRVDAILNTEARVI